MDKTLLYDYQNGNYNVKIYSDGTKIRETEEDKFIPAFAENCDVKITDRCDGGCPFCYEGCSINGKHAKLFEKHEVVRNGKLELDIEVLQEWLKNLHRGTELAINGNDLTHPDLDANVPILLYYLKCEGVITNITVNQKHFMKYYETLKRWSDNKLIYGIGISLSDGSDKEFFKILDSFPNAVIHTIAGITTIDDYFKLIGRKVLVLGYKTLGRGVDYKDTHLSEVSSNIKALKQHLILLGEMFKVLSFDNLALEQLNVKNILFKDRQDKWDTFYMGDDGKYTFYIDAVEETYAKNSCVSKEKRLSSVGLSIDEMFNNIIQSNQ